MAFSVFLFNPFANCLYFPEPGGFALVCGSGRGGGAPLQAHPILIDEFHHPGAALWGGSAS